MRCQLKVNHHIVYKEGKNLIEFDVNCTRPARLQVYSVGSVGLKSVVEVNT